MAANLPNKVQISQSDVSSNYGCGSDPAGRTSIGSFNRKRYDNCAYRQDLLQSTTPVNYHMFRSKFENCSILTAEEGKYYAPFDLVDVEAELLNITRYDSKCDENRYNPNCMASSTCLSTFDKQVPIVYPADLTPVVCSNIPMQHHPGYVIPNQDFCGMRPKKSEM